MTDTRDLPELDVTDEDKSAAMKWDLELHYPDNFVPVGWLSCRERQLAAALARAEQAEAERDGWRYTARVLNATLIEAKELGQRAADLGIVAVTRLQEFEARDVPEELLP